MMMKLAATLALGLSLLASVVSAEQYYDDGQSANYGYYSSVYGTNYYADTQQTYYDGYAQAWRYLGWYVDCNGGSSRYYQQSQHSGSGDNNNYYVGNNYCQRYLMWAAYVDESYSGGGIGEYAIFDTSNGYYDNTACNTNGNGNCKYMDCHDPSSTNWKLMGVFKEAAFFGDDAFFEQLFKHEGVCVWNDDDLYEFMSEAREGSWSAGCLPTGASTGVDNGYGDTQLYIDLKPTYNGNMTYALYSDYICATEYEGNAFNVESIAASLGLLYGSYMEQWNNAMEVFKVCQPCRAYNLQNSYSSSNKNRYSSYKQYWYGSGRTLKEGEKETKHEKFERELYNYNNNNNNNGYSANSGWYADDDDSYDPNNGYFRCDDDADYSNVNQCMKFRSHADLEAATWEDLVAATNQGGILQVNVSGVVFGSPFVSKEQDEYLTYVRRQKQAAYEKELKRKAQAAIASAPSGKSMVLIGTLWVAFGALALLLSVVRFIRQWMATRETRTLLEPLHSSNAGTMA